MPQASSRVSLTGLLLLLATTWPVAAEETKTSPAPAEYVKKDTWPDTVLACRAACLVHTERADIKLGPWHTTGPLPAKGFAEALFPEQNVDLTAKAADGKALWEPRQWADAQAHELPGDSRVATYLFRTVTVAAPVRVEASLGSDDGLAVWLNGKNVLSHDVARGVTPDGDRVSLDLQSGENRLLLKIFNQSGGYGFYFAMNQQAFVPTVWQSLEKDFPFQADALKRHLPGGKHLAWLADPNPVELNQEMVRRALAEADGGKGECLLGEFTRLSDTKTPANDRRWLALYERACRFRGRPAELRAINLTALRLAVEDLVRTFGGRYSHGPEFLTRLAGLEKRMTDLELALLRGDQSARSQASGIAGDYAALRRDALLANPLLDIDRLLVVKRGDKQLGLPQNWQGNCAIPSTGYDNEIAVLSPVRPEGNLSTLYKPTKNQFVGDVDLHFDADRMLFSMPGSNNRWQIWEIRVDGSGLRQVTAGEEPDADNYDPCYLPDGRIIFDSTRCFHGVPCVGGGNTVANLFIMGPDGGNVRQLCFDQDHDWCPTVLNNGRILYSRWEYTDTPHYFTRLLFHMNPDGTGQMEYYGSNSMWPNSIFYARPIPNHPSKVVAVISGHHGVPRMGELVVFDPGRGRHESSGAVQRIPGYGQKVQPIIADGLVEGSWPKFLHPYPLSEKYFLVSCKPTPEALWGLYLVDAFDNMILLKELPGYAILEPVPLRKTVTPPAIPDAVNPQSTEATVYLSDVYAGRGLDGVPRGTVKSLRIYSPHYAYPGMGGHINIGIDGPWDVHRILGTVPVDADGSASFKVPANVPLSVQPLDGEGRALQVMRSWFTAMPGEVLSCVGCHESQNTTPSTRYSQAARRVPATIKPWYGPERGFSFKREVQPVLEKNCVGCHDGKPRDGKSIPDFTLTAKSGFRNFTPSYVALHPFVRRPGPESDYHLQQPLEFHTSTSELVQMLKKGHHNVQLDAESWDRLYTWIDLNVPDFGTWSEQRGGHCNWEARRVDMRTKYANRPEDPEAIVDDAKVIPVSFVQPAGEPTRTTASPSCPGWPFDAAEAKRRQSAAAEKLPAAQAGKASGSADQAPELAIDLAQGVTLRLTLVPAGEFVMGDPQGDADECPPARVKIERPFYLGTFEVTNAQFAAFDSKHNSGVISMTNKDQSDRGYPVDQPNQPVVRVSWLEASSFCRWLSEKSGKKFALPTEAQWEWACRAGTNTPFSYGGLDTDFSKAANLADATLERLARGDSPQWHPRDKRFSDGALVTVDVGRYQPNAWGLRDMHGNAAEWTRSLLRPYPYNPGDGREDAKAAGQRVVRGGSWYDRPARSRSSFRLAYPAWQRVYNVGFRVMMEPE